MRLLPAAAVLLWLGIMAFFAFLVAPAAFASLEREAAGRFVGVMFPRYYAVGAGLGILAVAALGARWVRSGWSPSEWLSLGLALLMLALTLYAWLVVLPAAHSAREALSATGVATGAVSTEAAAFARLHRLSGVLNAAVMAAGVLFLIVEAVRRR